MDGNVWVGPGFMRDGWCIPQIGRNVEAMHEIRQVWGMTQDKSRLAQLALVWEMLLYNYPVGSLSSVQLLMLSIIPWGDRKAEQETNFFLFLAPALTS